MSVRKKYFSSFYVIRPASCQSAKDLFAHFLSSGLPHVSLQKIFLLFLLSGLPHVNVSIAAVVPLIAGETLAVTTATTAAATTATSAGTGTASFQGSPDFGDNQAAELPKNLI